MNKPSCFKCDVKINKKEDGYYRLYKLTKTGNKIYTLYFCDEICMMDYLVSAIFNDAKPWRIEDEKGIISTIEQFEKSMRK